MRTNTFAPTSNASPSDSRILVVDDEPLIRWAVSEVLEESGCDVAQASDARGAIAAIEAAPFDVVVLDLRLPDSDDLGLVTRVRRLSPASRIILMTAHGTAETFERASSLGVFGFLRKPFDMSELAAAVTCARQTRPC